jgi:CubicO group peptidase (beta-lactamase class C family)
MSLLDFANLHLFGRMGQPIPYWPRDPQGYCTGPGDVFLSPLQMASFGLLVLDRGRWRGLPVLDPAWVEESLEDSSETTWGDFWPYRNIRYGYLWWYAEVDGHEVHFAWGHGGQFITVVPSLDLVVVTTADNFLGDFSNASWYTEGSIFRLIARDVIPAAY